MSYGVELYFSESSRKAIFEQASIRIRTVLDGLHEDENDKNRFILNFIGSTFYHIKSHPELFDERCQVNIDSMGDRYVDGANRLVFNDISDMEFMLSTSYRFLVEYQLSTTDTLSGELLGLISRIYDYEYEGRTFSQLKYAEHQMLIDITKKYIHHPNITALNALPAQLEKAELERSRSIQDLSERETRVHALKDKLDTYKNAFNFFGLYDGFRKLRQAKGIEGHIGLTVLIFLALLMMCPFLLKFYFSLTLAPHQALDVQFYLALLGFEILLAYFFRVALQNYRSIKAQLIQIDLRMALCQFVQDYAVYAKEVSKDNPQLLDRFDQIVFSGIVNNEGSIPSTFDGLEQIANLIGKIRK